MQLVWLIRYDIQRKISLIKGFCGFWAKPSGKIGEINAAMGTDKIS
jgi:hypothetical protein